MGSRFICKVRTASGAVAVQVLDQIGRTTSVEHVGSANTDAELALLLRSAEQRLHPGQQAFDFGDVEQDAHPRSKSLTGPKTPHSPR